MGRRSPRLRLVSWWGCALLACACGSSPSAPTVLAPPASAAPAPAPPPSVITRRLTGFIRDTANQAVAGASVTAYGANNARHTTTSDSSGFYELMADLNPQVVPWITVDVTKPGYEDTQNGAHFRNYEDTTADFYVFELTRVQAGTDVRLAISFDGPLCGFELEHACRHVAMEASSAGTLTIEVTADDPAVTLGFGPVRYPRGSYPSRLTLSVRARQEVTAEILTVSSLLGSRRQSFTLSTTLTR
jgi:carboxypeptidase family protein